MWRLETTNAVTIGARVVTKSFELVMEQLVKIQINMIRDVHKAQKPNSSVQSELTWRQMDSFDEIGDWYPISDIQTWVDQ